MLVEPIGYVSSSRTEPVDDDWGDVKATITLDHGRFGPESLTGLQEFSHVEVIFFFHHVQPGEVQSGARHPRGNPDWPEVGIFAQRAKMRPNRLGASVCPLLAVDGLRVTVQALDAVDGTPVIDLKPYMAEFGPRGEVRQPGWATELMAGYWDASRGVVEHRR